MDLTKLSDIELKAFGYEQIAQQEACQYNIQLVAKELTRRNELPNPELATQAKEKK